MTFPSPNVPAPSPERPPAARSTPPGLRAAGDLSPRKEPIWKPEQSGRVASAAVEWLSSAVHGAALLHPSRVATTAAPFPRRTMGRSLRCSRTPARTTRCPAVSGGAIASRAIGSPGRNTPSASNGRSSRGRGDAAISSLKTPPWRPVATVRVFSGAPFPTTGAAFACAAPVSRPRCERDLVSVALAGEKMIVLPGLFAGRGAFNSRCLTQPGANPAILNIASTRSIKREFTTASIWVSVPFVRSP